MTVGSVLQGMVVISAVLAAVALFLNIAPNFNDPSFGMGWKLATFAVGVIAILTLLVFRTTVLHAIQFLGFVMPIAGAFAMLLLSLFWA